jgi:hypothetical protein
MGRKTAKGKSATHRMFNVVYEDGTQTSNRRIAVEQLDQTFGEDLIDLARVAIQAQDDEIAQRSNKRRAKIATISEV